MARLSRAERAALHDQVAQWLVADHRAHQLSYYRPLNRDCEKLHTSTAREFFISGGNKSSKTGTALAEAAIVMTGIVPLYFQRCATCKAAMEFRQGDWCHVIPNDAHDAVLLYPREKLKNGPVRVRLVVTSLVSAWDNNLKHKLQYFHWNGRLNEDHLPGDPRLGHWGWLPQSHLINGDWDNSWSALNRILRTSKGSTLSVMSHDQALEDFNQGAFDLALEDEIPPEAIHRANRIRLMELGGRHICGGTPADDRSSAVTAAWFFDEMAVGLEGSDPEKDAVVLWTENNPTLPADDVRRIGEGLTPEQREARFHGKGLHLSGLIIKGFTAKPKWWCLRCATSVFPVAGACATCGGSALVRYTHVFTDDDLAWPGPADWPTLFYMDPHQSKPTACAWFKIDPQDGWWQIGEREIEGDAAAVKKECLAFERDARLRIFWRKGDPKITAQGNQFAKEVHGQVFSIKRAFEEVDFYFEDANTNFSVAIDRIEQALKVQPILKVPRLRVYQACAKTIYQTSHFVWPGPDRRGNPQLKDQPSRKNSDFPALWRYLAMDDPTYRGCEMVRAGHVRRMTGDGMNRRTGW